MSTTVEAFDWEAQGIAQVGGGVGFAGGLYLFQFRSRHANFSGSYVFTGGGVGGGVAISAGGGSAPSPAQLYARAYPNMWTRLSCTRAFTADELDTCYGVLAAGTLSAAYGYSAMVITAGWIDSLFQDANVSGWGTGVAAYGSALVGLWQRMGGSETAYQ